MCNSPIDMLRYIYRENVLYLYPNLSIALRLLLTVPVRVASGERSFSRLKLSIEHQISRKLDYSKMIEEFAAAKARKVLF